MAGDNSDPKRTPLLLSARMTMAIMGFLCFGSMYSQRTNLSVGIVCMLNHTQLEIDNGPITNASLEAESGRCPIREVGQKKTDGPFAWSKSVQGLVLGSFFWGYLVTQLFGGQLAEKYSGKYVLLIGMSISTVGTLICPIVAIKGGHVWFIILRVIIGLSQGVVYPGFTTLWAVWAPIIERSVLVGFTYVGSQAGNIVALPVSGALCDAVGWESVFYFFGALSGAWCIAWYFLGFDAPAKHPRITEEEQDYIESSVRGHVAGLEMKKTPWRGLLTSTPAWAVIVAHACANFGKYLVLTMVPTFMNEVLRFDIKSNGLYSAFPYIGFFLFGNFASITTDYIRHRQILKTVHIRKIMNTIAFVGQAAFLVGVGYLQCGQTAASVAFLFLSSGLSGFQYGGFLVSHVDVAGIYAGTLMGISNSFATVDGIIAPYITSAMTPNQTIDQWRGVFWVTGAILLFGAVFYLLFASGDVQPWALGKKTDEEIVEEEEKRPLLPKNEDGNNESHSSI